MENKSFLSKFIFLLIIIVLIVVTVFFVMNKSEVDADMKNVELITSMNVDTYDEDLYIYKMENDIIYVSKYFYNSYYLSNNEVKFDEYNLNENTKFYLKTLSNTDKDINNVKISYDPITQDEFKYLLNNYTLLKIYIWLDDNDKCKNVLLYSSNNMQLEIEQYWG